jgi:hypothetical protein
MDISERVATLDASLFDSIETQTTTEDRRSLLALHAALAEQGPFEYLEIGSHLGGSLQALVRDVRCTRIVSIDSRPDSQPDERGRRFAYADNSADRMLGLLQGLEGADAGKVETIESPTDDVDPGSVGLPALIFIDGEHTDEAALADARWARAVLGDRGGAIAFHDAWIVFRAIRRFLDELPASGFTASLLPDSLVLVELGAARLAGSAPVAGRENLAVRAYLESLEQLGAYRDAFLERERHRRGWRRFFR